MKFSIEWLRDYLDLECSTQKICETLNKIGFESEIILDSTDKYFDQFFITKIKTIHPLTKKLNICTLDGYNMEVNQLVCGASNVYEGMYVILAPIGTVLNDGFEIKKAKIRETDSYGMFCSYSEVGIENFCAKYDGIADLGFDYNIGDNWVGKTLGSLIREKITDVVDVEVTPNRGDAISVMGIARELSAAGCGQINKDFNHQHESFCDFKGTSSESVVIDNQSIFSYCKLLNIKNKKSPQWLQSRMNAVGLKTISAVVDITNYIAHEIGRPLHAFDLNKLVDIKQGESDLTKQRNVKDISLYPKKPIYIKKSVQVERFKALDGNEYKIQENDLAIYDVKYNEIVSLAGIMGGESTMCDVDTTNILLESALFIPEDICRSASMKNIDSQAKYRFERGVDQDFILYGLYKAVKMTQKICGGQDCDHYIDNIEGSISFDFKKTSNETTKNETSNIDLYNTSLNNSLYKKPIIIKLCLYDLESFLGFKIESEKVISILHSLSINLVEKEIDLKNAFSSNLHFIIPSFRNDLMDQEDLFEEIIRLYGYDNIKEKQMSFFKSINSTSSYKLDLKKIITQNLLFKGFSELITWSFVDKRKDCKAVQILNPISETKSTMRQTIIENIYNNMIYNDKHSVEYNGFFEIGPVYTFKKQSFLQTDVVAVGSNKELDLNNFISTLGLDYRKISYDIDDLCYEMSNKRTTIKNSVALDFLDFHLKDIKIIYSDQIIGYIRIIGEKYFYEIFLTDLINQDKAPVEFDISVQQPIYRDFSFVVKDISNINTFIKEVNEKISIEKVYLFDDFREQDDGTNSFGLRFIMRKKDSTFTNEELQNISLEIIKTARIYDVYLNN